MGVGNHNKKPRGWGSPEGGDGKTKPGDRKNPLLAQATRKIATRRGTELGRMLVGSKGKYQRTAGERSPTYEEQRRISRPPSYVQWWGRKSWFGWDRPGRGENVKQVQVENGKVKRRSRRSVEDDVREVCRII